ncbi:MAG: hypothetical protein GY946_07920 [bacterium]|nr:hypothetical protein [bacterium]
MQTLEQLKNRTPHDIMLAGNNSSYIVTGHFPREALGRILPGSMSIPSDEVMASKFPGARMIDGMHPFMMMFSNCRNVHDVMTEIELRHYRELMFFIPVNYTNGKEEQLCSYVPVLYLEYLIGVIGGLYLGLRKEFHPRMEDIETETSKYFAIKGILNARFEKEPAGDNQELDSFFTQMFENPTTTVSYLNRTFFYTTKAHPTKVLNASSEFEWRYKGTVIKNRPDTVANYSEYHFTTSQAMSYDAYFHPAYSVE